MPKSLVIIGGGVIGLSCAYYAAKAGHRVTLVDRGGPDRDSCAHGSAGMITPSHFVPLAAPGMVALGLKWMFNPESPFWIKPRLSADLLNWAFKFWGASNARHVERTSPLIAELNLASRAQFVELEREWCGAFDLAQRGLLMLCKSQRALDEEAHFAALANSLGVSAQVLDTSQAAALDPGARMDIAGAIYFPKDCHLTPTQFITALQSHCEKLGVTFRWNSDVSALTQRGSRITAANTSTGALEAEEFILAGGSWSARLARSIGLNLPMQAGKGYSLTLAQPRQLPRLCSILTEARVAVTPMGSALRFGGTMELGGLNHDINPARVRGIIKSALRCFPDFTEADFAAVKPWCGLRPCSPDGLPYLGRTAKFANLTVATGHAMMGLSLGPITGQLVAELLEGGRPSHDLSLLSPDRYA